MNKELDYRLCVQHAVTLAELHSLPKKELEALRADLLFKLANL